MHFLVSLLYPWSCKGSEQTAVGFLATSQSQSATHNVFSSNYCLTLLTFVMFPYFNVTSLPKALLSSTAMVCGQKFVQLLTNSPTLIGQEEKQDEKSRVLK